MERAYAQAVMSLLEKGMEPKSVAARLKEVLTTRGHMKLSSKIATELHKFALGREATRDAKLFVAKKEDEARAKEASKEFLTGSSPDVVVDGSLIGGWKLLVEGKRVDASFKKQLVDLYRTLTA